MISTQPSADQGGGEAKRCQPGYYGDRVELGSNRKRPEPDGSDSAQTRGGWELQRGLEQHGAGTAVRPWPARLAHADVWIGRWLVQPRAWQGWFAAAPEEGD